MGIRRLESLEHQSEQVMKALSDVRDVGGLRDDATKERFASIDKTLRDIQRGVQLVRDKQVCLNNGLTPFLVYAGRLKSTPLQKVDLFSNGFCCIVGAAGSACRAGQIGTHGVYLPQHCTNTHLKQSFEFLPKPAAVMIGLKGTITATGTKDCRDSTGRGSAKGKAGGGARACPSKGGLPASTACRGASACPSAGGCSGASPGASSRPTNALSPTAAGGASSRLVLDMPKPFYVHASRGLAWTAACLSLKLPSPMVSPRNAICLPAVMILPSAFMRTNRPKLVHEIVSFLACRQPPSVRRPRSRPFRCQAPP